MASKKKNKKAAKAYKANISDSLKKLGSSYVETHMPALHDIGVATGQVISVFRKDTLRDRTRLRSGLKAQQTAFRTYMGTTYNNLKADLKSGKLYNTERFDTSDSIFGGMMDSYLPESEGMGDVRQTADALANNISASVMSEGFRDTGKVLTGTADYLGNTITAGNTQALIAQNRFHMEQMKSLGNIQQLAQAQVNFNLNEMKGFIAESLDYYHKTSATLDSIYQELKQMSNANAARYGMGTQSSKMNPLDLIFGGGRFDIKEYAKQVKQNAKDQSGGTLGLLLSMGGDLAGNFKNNPLGSILKLGMNAATPKAMKKGFGRVNDSVNGLMASFLMGMNSLGENSKSGFGRFLGQMFGVDTKVMKGPMTASYKNQQLTLEVENKKNKAITEVIPQYLSEITRALTGVDKMFDYNKGVFVDRKARKKELDAEMRTSIISTMSDSRKAMQEGLMRISGSIPKKDNELYKEDVDQFMYFLATYGKNLDYERLSKMTYKEATKTYGLNLKGGEKSFKVIKALYASLSKDDKSRLRTEQVMSVSNVRSLREFKDRELNESGNMIFYSGFYDDPPKGGSKGGSRPAARRTAGGGGSSRPRKTMKRAGSSSSDPIGSMTDEELIERIRTSASGGTFKTEEELKKESERSEFDKAFDKAQAGFTGKIGKFFNMKNNKVLNSLFGDKGFFPGILDATADTISDVMYGNDPKKNKGVFAELFSGIKDTATGLFKDIKTVVQGKFGESAFYKKIWGDPKTGEKGMLGEMMQSFKDNIITPVKTGLEKHVLTPLKGKFKKFYDAHLKDKMDKLREEAKKYGEKAKEEGTMIYHEAIGREGPETTDQPSSSGDAKKPSKVYKVKKKTQIKAQDVMGESAPTEAKPADYIQQVQIAYGQAGAPVLVKLVGDDFDESKIIRPGKFQKMLKESTHESNDDMKELGKKVLETGTNAVKGIMGQMTGDTPVEGHAKGGKLKPGLSVVGEKGPEVLVSGGGDSVIPNNRPLKVEIANFGEGAQETISQTAGYIASSNLNAGGGGDGEGGEGKPKKKGLLGKLFSGGKKAKEKVQEKGGIGGVFESIKNKMKNSTAGGAAGGAAVSTLLGLGPMPGLIVGAVIGRNRKFAAEKAKMKAEAEAQGKEFDKEAWKARKKEMKGKGKGGVGGAAAGAVVSTLLGLGPLPGILVGSIIGKKRAAKKAAEAEAKANGQAVDDAAEQTKGGKIKNFFKKGKGAVKGALVSTLLGLGPVPGAIIGSIIAKRKASKAEEKEAKDAGESVDGANKKVGFFGKLKAFFKKGKGAVKGALVSTLLGLGPIPGAIVGMMMAKRKMTKQEEKEAKEAGEAADNQNASGEKKQGRFSKFIGGIKDKIGSLKDKITKQIRGKEKVSHHAFGGKTKKGINIVGESGPEAIISNGGESVLPNHKPLKVEVVSFKDKAAGFFSRIFGKKKQDDGAAERRKNHKAAKVTQKHTKMLTDSSGDAGKTMKNVKNLLNSADTPGEMASLEQSTSIMANAAGIASNGPSVIQAVQSGEKGGGLLSSLMNIFGSNGLFTSLLNGLLQKLGLGKLTKLTNGKQTLKSKVTNWFKNNKGDLYSGAQIFAGVNNIKEGKELMQGDKWDQETGSGKIVRGAVQTTSGGLKLVGTVANGVAHGLGAGGKATSTLGKVASKVTQSATKPGGAINKVVGFISKGIKGIVKKISNLVGKKGGKIIASSADNIAGQVCKKGAAQIAGKAASFIAKWSNVAGWALVIAQLVVDFGTGWADVKNIMETEPGYDPPLKLKIVSGLSKAISGLLLGLIPVKWLASIIFGIIGSDAEKAELQETQAQHRADYEAYIKAHPEAEAEGMTFEKWNQQQNRTTWGKVKDWFGNAGTKIKEWGSNAIDKVKEWGAAAGSKIKEWGAGVVDKAKEFGSKAIEGVKTFASNVGDKVKELGGKAKELATKAMDGVKDFAGKIGDKLKDFGSNLLNKAKDFAAGVVDKVKNVVGGIKDAVGGVVNKVKDAVGGVVDKVKNSAVGKAVSNVANKAKEGVKKAANAVKNAGKKVLGGIKKLFGGGGRGEEAQSTIPYQAQNDPRWANRKYGYYDGQADTIGKGGCGPAVASMMMNGITNADLTPADVAAIAEANGMKSDGTSTDIFQRMGDQYGVAMNGILGLTDEAVSALRNGTPVAMLGDASGGRGDKLFGKGAHYVLGHNADDEGVEIYDPQNKANNKKFPYSKLKNVKASIVPQTPQVSVPTKVAESALKYKNSNKISSAVSKAKNKVKDIVYSDTGSGGRGEGGNSVVSKIYDVANEMLNCLQTISDTLVNMDERAALAQAQAKNKLDGQSSSGDSYSSKENSAAKTSMYNQAVTA